MSAALIVWCPHLSLSGAEGPVALLGRAPIMYVCDRCGSLEVAREVR